MTAKKTKTCPKCGQPIRSKRCAHCREVFHPQRADARYCSIRCRVAATRKRQAQARR